MQHKIKFSDFSRKLFDTGARGRLYLSSSEALKERNEGMSPIYQKYSTIRDAQNLNDHQVAVATGLHPSLFYDWKAGRYSPKLDKISKLAAYFGVKLEDLLGE